MFGLSKRHLEGASWHDNLKQKRINHFNGDININVFVLFGRWRADEAILPLPAKAYRSYG